MTTAATPPPPWPTREQRQRRQQQRRRTWLAATVAAVLVAALAAIALLVAFTSAATAAPVVSTPVFEQGPPVYPGHVRIDPAPVTPAPAQPAPAPVKPAPVKPAVKPKPKASVTPKLTCDLNAPVKLVGNQIVNRACGYVGKDGLEHSRDPWIEDQLRAARGLPVAPAPKVKPAPRVNPGTEGAAALRACMVQKHWTKAQCIADAAAGNAN